MLVLTRRIGETLIIGEDIRVTVLAVSGHQIRLGVTAPREVPVHREEVAERIRGEVASSGARTSRGAGSLCVGEPPHGSDPQG